MHLSTGLTAGLGCALVVQVSSFAVSPLSASSQRPGRAARAAGHHDALSRPGVRHGGLARCMSLADEELWRGEPWDESEEGGSQVLTKPKVASELEDVMSEFSQRTDDDEFIAPRNAGIGPMPPGRIKADPIPGMDADDVPGKIVVDLETLAQQQRDLEQVARVLRRERLDAEREENRFFGWTPTAEKWNGRSAMVGIAAGMFIEAVTGASFPAQIEGIAQTLGLLPLDYESYFQ